VVEIYLSLVSRLYLSGSLTMSDRAINAQSSRLRNLFIRVLFSKQESQMWLLLHFSIIWKSERKLSQSRLYRVPDVQMNVRNDIRGWRETHPTETNPLFRGSQISPLRVNEVLARLSLFSSHFFIRIWSPTRKTAVLLCYRRPFHGVKSCFSRSPLVYHKYRPCFRGSGP
jgi:hypothetical protein